MLRPKIAKNARGSLALPKRARWSGCVEATHAERVISEVFSPPFLGKPAAADISLGSG